MLWQPPPPPALTIAGYPESLVDAYKPTIFADAGSAAALIVKDTPGSVFAIYTINRNAAERYLQLHNRDVAPVAADAAMLWWPLPAESTLALGLEWFTRSGLFFSTGIAIGFSTTPNTYTAAAAADTSTMLLYK